MVACSRALHLLGEYEAAVEREEPTQANTEAATSSWQPPRRTQYKVNTDAAIKEDKISFGMVVRDVVGDVLMSAGTSRITSCTALQAEAEAMRFGLKYSYDTGFRSVEAESDCLHLVELLCSRKRERSYTQVIVDDILVMASNFAFCSFNFAKRSCNSVVHSIAKSSFSLTEEMVWMEDHPMDVLPLVIADKAFLYQ